MLMVSLRTPTYQTASYRFTRPLGHAFRPLSKSRALLCLMHFTMQKLSLASPLLASSLINS